MRQISIKTGKNASPVTITYKQIIAAADIDISDI
jgi:hypothetical protein